MMEIFGMGTGEILLVLLVALLIWGPGRIVDIGSKLGRMVRALKKMSFDLTSQVSKELDSEGKDHPPEAGEKTSDKAEESVTAR